METKKSTTKITPKGRRLRKQWIRALESGHYQQGTELLRQRNDKGKLEYCCLGVLCNLVNPKLWGESEEYTGSGVLRTAYNFQGSEYGVPPKEICQPVSGACRLNRG